MRSALILSCLLLVGCATVNERPAPDGGALAADGFYLSGRVSVKYGAEAASGSISWRHDAAGDELLFSAPLGQGLARIVWRDGVARLTTSDRTVYQAGDVETLTEQVLGWRLPLAGLPDWVRGSVAPGAPAQGQLDETQRLSELRQSGWRVEFLAYGRENGLPSRLRLTRADIELRLVIDDWRGTP